MRLISNDANLTKILLQKGFDEREINEFVKRSKSIILRFETEEDKDFVISELSRLGYFALKKDDIVFATTDMFNFENSKCALGSLIQKRVCDFDTSYSMRAMSFKGKKIALTKTNVMGIINITPDSFYEGSRVDADGVLKKAEKMIEDGADIIDIGGESTRPFSEPVSKEEELKRVIPAIETIRSKYKDIAISVDTYKSEVAYEAIKSGADIVNDISGGTFDEDMFHVCADLDVPIVIMHIKGTPKNMQTNPYYDDVIEEIMRFFENQIDKALKCGVDFEKIILDPGIGFGKRVEDNLEILRRCEEFKALNRPVLIGASRKSTIGHVLGGLLPDERLEGTIAISTICAMKKIEFVRVHDVLENKRAIMMAQAIMNC